MRGTFVLGLQGGGTGAAAEPWLGPGCAPCSVCCSLVPAAGSGPLARWAPRLLPVRRKQGGGGIRHVSQEPASSATIRGVLAPLGAAGGRGGEHHHLQ